MKKIIYILSLFSLQMSAQVDLHLPHIQKRKIWMDAGGVSVMVLAGLANGIKEAMHADPTLMGKGQGFWQDQSWKRKYKDYDGGDLRAAYPGAKNILAWTTDAHHFTGSVKTAGLFTGTVLLTVNENFSLKRTGLRLLGGFVAYGLTSHITYNHLRYGTPFK